MFQLSEKKESSSRPVIQPSLKIGRPGDKYEQEADAVAEKVMMMSESETMQMQPVEEEEEESIQMQPVDQVMVQMKCSKCEDEEIVQTKSHKNDKFLNSNFSYQLQSSNSSGFNLSNDSNLFMSSVFGTNFDNVRLHTDSKAVQMNRQLGARAFTHGQNIFFNSGEYNPVSHEGKRLLAHELTHVVQQNENSLTPLIQKTEETNQSELDRLREILDYVDVPEEEVIAIFGSMNETDSNTALRDSTLKDQAISALNNYEMYLAMRYCDGDMKTRLEWMFAEGTDWEYVRSIIQAATIIQRNIALNDQHLLMDLKSNLSWDDWARSIELLGRSAPTGNQMTLNSIVTAAMQLAWTASNPAVTRWSRPQAGSPLAAQCNPINGAPPTTAHEEGGFIYLNLINGNISTNRVAAGGQASLPLSNPANVADSIVVGGYHTHPNVGNCWGSPFFSQADIDWSNINGVPLLMIGAFPGIANTSFHATGPARRHLAGNRGLPGAAGGLAPQSTLDGIHDEL